MLSIKKGKENKKRQNESWQKKLPEKISDAVTCDLRFRACWMRRCLTIRIAEISNFHLWKRKKKDFRGAQRSPRKSLTLKQKVHDITVKREKNIVYLHNVVRL